MKMKTVKYTEDQDILIVSKSDKVLVLAEDEAGLVLELFLKEETELDTYLEHNSKTGDDALWVRLGKLRALRKSIQRQIAP